MESWLEDEAEGGKIFLYIGLYVPLALVVSLLAGSYFISVHAPLANQTATVTELKSLGPVIVWPVLFIAAAAEELIFRLFPLVAAFLIFGRRLIPVLAIALGASLIFGVLHGNYLNIFIQGASGFLLSLLFLKCGGYNGNILKAVASSSLGHFLLNGLIALTLFLH